MSRINPSIGVPYAPIPPDLGMWMERMLSVSPTVFDPQEAAEWMARNSPFLGGLAKLAREVSDGSESPGDAMFAAVLFLGYHAFFHALREMVVAREEDQTKTK